MSEPTTKDRILDAAERLFANCGFEATSLRMITSEAGVNLASVNYHFQSKEALLHAVFARRANPVNQRRLELLSECEAHWQNEAIPVERLLDAFFRPVVLEMGGCIPKMLIRFQFLEPQETVREVFATHMKPVAQRFFPAFHRSLPHLTPPELFLRIQFAVGGLSQMLAGTRIVEALTEGKVILPSTEAALQHLIQFAAAGLRAPSPGVAA